MLEPENSLVNLKEIEQQTAGKVNGAGRPKKTQDAIAQERNADIEWLEGKNLKIRRNMLTGDIEYLHPSRGLCIFQGDDMTTFTHLCAEVFGETIVESRMRNAILFVADKHRYHPVQDYLNRCANECAPSPNFDKISTVYLNNSIDIANEALKRFMVGLVSRAFNPGSPLSYLPILQGEQGLGKSRFARELVGSQFFAEMSASLQMLTKEPYRMHVGWLIELPECDRYFTPQEAENLKNLVTISIDEVRLPYSLPKKAPRSFGFLGTTNQSEFLVDATGNRRFIPIKIKVDPKVGIDIDQLIEERDSLWAAAVLAYRSGAASEFTSGELAQLREYQADFLELDSWADTVVNFVQHKPEVSVADILTNGIGVALDRHNNGHKRRITAILKTLGWTMKSTSRNGRSIRIWLNPKDAIRDRLDDF